MMHIMHMYRRFFTLEFLIDFIYIFRETLAGRIPRRAGNQNSGNTG